MYEASPLDRVNKQYGAGAAWYSGHPVATDYLANTVSGVLSCKLYTIDGNTLNDNGGNLYAAGMLQVVKTTDEDGNISYTFTDKQGRTVLNRQMNGTEQLDTYYVYDAKGNLCFVLQPMYQTTANLSLYAFQYKYDNRNLCIWKKLPGADSINYEYNEYDQLVFSQDGNQRATGKWTFYVYDKFNRLTQQGENTSQTVSSTGVYLQNFYDDYVTFRAALPNDVREQYLDDTSDNAKGSLTGTIMNVFGSSEKIYIVYYYDIKGRVIKTIENNLVGGYNTTVTTYTFSDQPATVTLTHTANGKLTQTEVYTYTYDHSDRISSVTHKLNSNAAVTLASYTYDNKGRMATKKLHGSSTNQLTYAYNIRSWLTGISSNKFTQNLTYNNGSTGFNGNITAMNWTVNGSSHSYAFTYDGVNRMLNATHGTGAYTEKVTGYDKNGNITGLQRYNSSLVDNLTYIYNGNQLTKVEDATGNTTGFTDGSHTNGEYTYDNNGNLTKDLNKGISNISYNVLSLPQVVTFSNGNTITYLYTADGRKLRTVHVINGTATTTDYCGNVIYENSTQKLLLTEEGYVDLANGNAYYYYLKDHQGNNRVVINSSGTVQEVNHYYPFGSTFVTSNVQPYKYNGKELDTKNGLNWYDCGARHYDAVLGRWHVVDPLAEKMYCWSPYGYCLNNPIIFIDPNGKREWPVNKTYKEYNRRHENNFGAPRGNGTRSHKGVDINYTGGKDTDKGAPILATHDGVVTQVVRIGKGDKGAGGNRIYISSEDGIVTTAYMHLDEIGGSIQEGTRILEGQQIGTMGKSGYGKQEYEDYFAHLHYEIKVDGKTINPAIDSNSLIDPQELISPINGGVLQQIEITANRVERERIKFVDLVNSNNR